MPLSSFSEGLRNGVMLLPGTYGTSLIRNHALSGVFREMENYLPEQAITAIKDSIDCNLYFFGEKVEISTAYLVICLSVIILIGAYVTFNILRAKKNN
jgi:multidrug/hemolysin transport system permease protein